MPETIRVGILDDHQMAIDGYRYRLERDAHIQVTLALLFGDELEPALRSQPVDVLILDVSVPTSAENSNPYPIIHLVPRLLDQHPELQILIISMYAERTLIKTLMEAGASGYILKEDAASLRELPAIVHTIAGGGIYLSQLAYKQLAQKPGDYFNQPLSPRQLEALSLAAAYPDDSTYQLSGRMNIAHSSLRNLLSNAYIKLGVRSKSAAIIKARQLNLITPLHGGYEPQQKETS